MDSPLEDYLSGMAKPGSYGDHVILQCIRELLGCQIKVIQLGIADSVVGRLDSEHVLHVGYMADIQHYVSVVRRHERCCDEYHAVYYTEPADYYIGRLTSVNCSCPSYPVTHFKMFFLKRNYIDQTFSWPKMRKPECVQNQYLFCGPLTLEGVGPFRIQEFGIVEKRFKQIKRKL